LWISLKRRLSSLAYRTERGLNETSSNDLAGAGRNDTGPRLGRFALTDFANGH
jgi:hypothetical protein